LRVEFSLKIDSGYPKDVRVTTHWPGHNLDIPFAQLMITALGQLYQSLPSPIPEVRDLGRCINHHSHVLEYRDTYGQAQVCSKAHQVSRVDCPCHCGRLFVSKFWLVQNPPFQGIRLCLSVLVHYYAGDGVCLGERILSSTVVDG